MGTAMETIDGLLELGRAASEGSGLAGIVTTLRRRTGEPAAFVDLRGSLLASSPQRSNWPTDEVVAWNLSIETLGEPPVRAAPVTLEQDVVALLLSKAAGDHEPLLRLASELASLELAKLQATLAGRRELATQVLEDVFHRVSQGTEARERLAALGVDLAETAYSVVVGRCKASDASLKMRPWNLHSLLNRSGDPYARAMIDRDVVLVVPAAAAMPVAELLLEHLRSFDRTPSVGVGPSAFDPLSLSMSYYQAVEAAARAGVQRARPLNLGYILLGSARTGPLRELSETALSTLTEHDRTTGSELMRTLEVFLQADCSMNGASKELFVHRNTLRYRLNLIAELTGWSTDSFEGRLHFWIAMRALGIGASRARSGNEEA